MSSTDPTNRIREAASLVKAGDRQQAYAILREVIIHNPKDWRAWWGLVYAAPDTKERHFALKKTVQLNPNHEKAAGLLRQYEASRQAQTAQPASTSGHAAPPREPFGSGTAPQVETFPPAPWDNPFEAPVPAADPFGDPFGAPVTASSRMAQRGGPPPSAAARSRARRSSDLNRVLLIGGGVFAVLAVVIVLVLLGLSQVQPGGFAPAGDDGAPNTYDGDDPYYTTGGGTVAVNGGGVTDGIYSLFEAHNWTFEGYAGQAVTISVEAIGDTDPRFSLLDPDGRVIADDDDSGRAHGLGVWDSYLTLALPRDGTYTVRIDVFTPGEFVLRVTSA